MAVIHKVCKLSENAVEKEEEKKKKNKRGRYISSTCPEVHIRFKAEVLLTVTFYLLALARAKISLHTLPVIIRIYRLVVAETEWEWYNVAAVK